MTPDQVEVGQATSGHPTVGDDDSPEVQHCAVERQMTVAAITDRSAERGDRRLGADHDDGITGLGPAAAAGHGHRAGVFDPAEANIRETLTEFGELGQSVDRHEHRPVDDLLGSRRRRWWWGQVRRQWQSASEQQRRHQQHRQDSRRVGQ